MKPRVHWRKVGEDQWVVLRSDCSMGRGSIEWTQTGPQLPTDEDKMFTLLFGYEAWTDMDGPVTIRKISAGRLRQRPDHSLLPSMLGLPRQAS